MFKKLRRKLLTIFGDIKVFKWPFWLVYDPSLFKITGKNMRDIDGILKIGDVVCRKYVHYADGFFIPGEYSHSGIYVGDGKIIHAIAEGVGYTDVLDFTMCDGIIIMRPKDREMVTKAVSRAKSYVGTAYDFGFAEGDSELYCHELTANCYKELELEKFIPSILFGLIKGKHKVYLAKSFIESDKFEKVYEA